MWKYIESINLNFDQRFLNSLGIFTILYRSLSEKTLEI